jgi:hypothetical protein
VNQSTKRRPAVVYAYVSKIVEYQPPHFSFVITINQSISISSSIKTLTPLMLVVDN